MAGGSRPRREQVRGVALRGYERSRKGFVYVITSDKIIQSVLTGSVTAVIFSINDGVSAYFQLWLSGATGLFIPVKIVAAIGAVIVFVLAYYADQHTEEWRSFVREKTGEDTSDDMASNEDVTGEEKE